MASESSIVREENRRVKKSCGMKEKRQIAFYVGLIQESARGHARGHSSQVSALMRDWKAETDLLRGALTECVSNRYVCECLRRNAATQRKRHRLHSSTTRRYTVRPNLHVNFLDDDLFEARCSALIQASFHGGKKSENDNIGLRACGLAHFIQPHSAPQDRPRRRRPPASHPTTIA